MLNEVVTSLTQKVGSSDILIYTNARSIFGGFRILSFDILGLFRKGFCFRYEAFNGYFLFLVVAVGVLLEWITFLGPFLERTLSNA